MLLVEGSDDAHVVKNLLGRHKIPAAILPKYAELHNHEERLKIFSTDGLEQMFKFLGLVDVSELAGLAAICDGDRDDKLASRWDRLKFALKIDPRVGLPADGYVERQGEIRIGVWRMPDNASAGRVQDFVIRMIPPQDRLLPQAQRAVTEACAVEQRFKEQFRSKAELYTWLAWQKEPGPKMGASITTGVLDSNAELAVRFVGWVKRFAEIE